MLKTEDEALKKTVDEEISEEEDLEVDKTKNQVGRAGLKKKVKEVEMVSESMNSMIEVIKKKK